MKLQVRFTGILLSAGLALVSHANADDTQNAAPHVSYVDGSHSTLLLDVAGKQYVVDVAAGSIREAGATASQTGASQTGASQGPSPAAGLFQQNCAGCHGTDGKGTRSLGTPDF